MKIPGFLSTGIFVLGLSASVSSPAAAAGLRGSPRSMETQHDVAVDERLEFLDSAREVQELVAKGELEKVEGNADYSLVDVSFPYARPEVRLFIERISRQYHEEVGSKLVVTSLTRPMELQPRNAHQLSVHPAGMAVDFRIPGTSSARAWVEKVLLGLENAGVLDVTREKSPPHYHVAVFPAEYLAYVKKADARVKAATPAVALIPTASMGPISLDARAFEAGEPGSHAPLILLFITVLLAPLVFFRRIAGRIRRND